MEPNIKIKLFLDKREQGIVQPDGTYSTQNYSDYYFNVFLTRELKIIDEYIDIQLDPLRVRMEKQLINPWFIEFGFFGDIGSTGISASTNVNNYKTIINKAKLFSIDINK